MALIYVPNYQNGNCAYIYNSDIIRVYDRVPSHNSIINYKDYYIKSSYIYNEGSTSFGNYATLPVCISNDRITTDVYYRNDFMQILIIFFLLSWICFLIPWKIFLRLFRRYQ